MAASAHDISDGGIAQALVESSLRSGLGVMVTVPSQSDAFVFLWSESASRAVFSVSTAKQAQFEALCQRHGVVCAAVGQVQGLPEVTIHGVYGESVAVSLDDLRQASEATLPGLFG